MNELNTFSQGMRMLTINTLELEFVQAPGSSGTVVNISGTAHSQRGLLACMYEGWVGGWG